ncbi:MAG: MBL fold metallo-hydrolase [Porphyromonas sp.]|nr:MBL fold metallo-hydrolase [Porphyromonas sp.]
MKTLHFIAHSTCLIETEDSFLLFDFYDSSSTTPILMGLLSNEKPLLVFCTHSHHDHYSPNIFSLLETFAPKYIFCDQVRESTPPEWRSDVIFLSVLQEYTLEEFGLSLKVYGSTDEGGSFYIRLQDGFSLFYAGDLNHWHWDQEANAYYQSLYAAAYKKELAHISSDCLSTMDLLLFPTDLRLGPNYLRGLREFFSIVTTTRYLAPIHWNGTPSDTKELEQMAREHKFQIIDTSQGAISFILK